MLSGSNYHVQGPQISQFNNIDQDPIPRSAFRRDFTRRSTFDASWLVPIFLDEILPGDDINLKLNAFVRVNTPIKPIMDNLYFETFWFFVPNRLVWDNWERFQGQQTNPGDSVAYTIPVLDTGGGSIGTNGFANSQIYDYFGLPTQVTGLTNISALYNRAYDLIYNEWFRDENLQNSITVSTGDGPDNANLYVIRNRNKRKDYITSCLPWPQKGDPVTINLSGTAPVIRNPAGTPLWIARVPNSTTPVVSSQVLTSSLGELYGSAGAQPNISLDPMGSLVADVSTVSITINALRQSALYQQILELDARGGTRYVESIYSRFGVISPDFRLQRPELIGQGSTRINIYAVPQTAPSAAGTTPQGNLAAFGTTVIHGDHGCRYAATEHGMVLGIANVRADLTYQQGIPKMFSRRTRLDFYEPLLNGLGEQAVLMKEIYAQGTSADNTAFGYQERFAEYRFKQSEITGRFRSNFAQSLQVWHLSQYFASAPALNGSFISENVPMARVVAVPSEPSFLFDAAYEYNHVRPMPIRSNPGIDKL